MMESVVIDTLLGETFTGLIFIATLVFVVTQQLKRVLARYIVRGETHGDLVALVVAVTYCLITGTSYLSLQGIGVVVPWAMYVDQVFSGFIVAYLAGMERNILKKAGVIDTPSA